MKPNIDDALKWAREAGEFMVVTFPSDREILIRYGSIAYKAGAAAMKERAAKMCESINEDFDSALVERCIEAIRALGDDDE